MQYLQCLPSNCSAYFASNFIAAGLECSWVPSKTPVPGRSYTTNSRRVPDAVISVYDFLQCQVKEIIRPVQPRLRFFRVMCKLLGKNFARNSEKHAN